MPSLPDVFAAEPIPKRALEEIQVLLGAGDLFRYKSGISSPVACLEAEFAEMMGVPFALAVSSCSGALFLALKALGFGNGERVLLPAFTFAAVPSAVVHAGCTPVLAECGTDFRVDLKDFEQKLQSDIDAVIISHMRGQTSDMDAILQLCEEQDIPVIEDAAHSLGTTWHGKKIGTLGKVGCFSFQSYKLINAGEGGILITEDPEIIARATIMSGAYEHNWKHHKALSDRCTYWQNKLPLYNMRMNNISAVVIRSQLDEIPGRVRDGRRNHDYVAAKLNATPFFDVPDALPAEKRAPDSIQFNLHGFDSYHDVNRFVENAREQGIDVQVFGLSKDNARAFWNWQFMDIPYELPKTRAMLTRACDVRLPTHLGRETLDEITNVLIGSAEAVLRGPVSEENTPVIHAAK